MKPKWKTVAVVQEPGERRERIVGLLEQAGYGVQVCDGPAARDFECWAYEYADCPLWQKVDLLIYDPSLQTAPTRQSCAPVLELEHRRHPEKPVLICGGVTGAAVDVLDLARSADLEVVPGGAAWVEILATVRRLVGPPGSPIDPLNTGVGY